MSVITKLSSPSRLELRKSLAIQEIANLNLSGNYLIHAAESLVEFACREFGIPKFKRREFIDLVLETHRRKFSFALRFWERHDVQEKCFELDHVYIYLLNKKDFILHIRGNIWDGGHDEIMDFLRNLPWVDAGVVISNLDDYYIKKDLLEGTILYGYQDFWKDHPIMARELLGFLNSSYKKKHKYLS